MYRIPLSMILAASALFSLSAAESVDFNRDIRPILSDKCFACHGPDLEHRKADLALNEEDNAKIDRGGYAVIAPGSPLKSEAILRIRTSDPEDQMPPPETGKNLTQEEISKLEAWIAEGAPYAEHWAYVAPRSFPLPKTEYTDWSDNWIDHFILSTLEKSHLAPSPETDPMTLVRRLSFDLTGLPPDPATVNKFNVNPSPIHYEAIVDRLLASPAFGERMAIYWLDLVRYADTVGYHGDQTHNITPYRDWVIEAFNQNLPFNQFTVDQIAGDLIPEATIDQKIATGYNRLLQTSHEGGVQPKEYLAIYAADRVRNVSTVWMGATLGCAQCHDHKYDPFTAKDFYSMAAFFGDIDEAQHFKVGTNSLPTQRPPEIEAPTRQEREISQIFFSQIAALENTDPILFLDQISKLRKEELVHRKNIRKSMITVATTPRTTRVLPRGNWLDETGQVVTPAVPEFLGAYDNANQTLNRLDLAHWLTDAEKGIGGHTSRVMVNRFWYLLFGVGLSKSLSDFGGQGQAPSHPKLLDNLAVEFVRNGWDVKQLIKQIVLSKTYKQSSVGTQELAELDPYNQLFARQARFRLPAEMVRDNALSIAGMLTRSIGGSSVKPFQPVGYYKHLNFPKREYQQDSGQSQWRRGVYVHWQRQFLHPMLKAMDAPSREECTAERPQSNTPLAALTLLNDPTFVEAAKSFANRIVERGGPSDYSRINFGFQLATSRPPDDQEHQTLLDLKNALEQAGTDDVQVWIQIARALLNLNETITRN